VVAAATSGPRVAAILDRLRDQGSEANRAGMARYGINIARACGVSVAVLRPLARELGRDPDLARELWASGVHEARILACLVHEPAAASRAELAAMVRDIDSWDLCDQFANNLARRTPGARETARDWLGEDAPFVKRAGLSLLASLAVHDTASPEAVFAEDLAAVAAVAADGRQPVRKAVSWAIRQIGKRGEELRRRAVAVAAGLAAGPDKAAHWAARDALRELTRPDVAARTAAKAAGRS